MTLTQQYRVLRMEPLVGDDLPDPRTDPSLGTASSAPGPDMQATRAYEGQIVTLAELEGMGHLQWESERVARLDTASESYQLQLEPLGSPDAARRAVRESNRVEAVREQTPTGMGAPWLWWLVLALIVLVVIGIWLVLGGTAIR